MGLRKMPRGVQRVILTGRQIEQLTDRIIQYVLANWRRFAYVDNTDCVELRLYKLSDILGLNIKQVPPTYRGALLDEIIRRFKQMGYTVQRVFKRNTGKAGDCVALVICRPSAGSDTS